MTGIEKPRALQVLSDAIPTELKAIKAWVVWRYEWQKEKWTKEPYQVDSEKHAKRNDPSTWGPFDRAIRRYEQADVDGIGFSLSKLWGIVGVDLDHCRELSGAVALWAVKIMHEIQSYTEFSPSGNGIRILVKAVLLPGRRKKGDIEMYDELRYLTITGHHRTGHPKTIEPRQLAVEMLHRWIFRPIRPLIPIQFGRGAIGAKRRWDFCFNLKHECLTSLLVW
jgi:primase-polymerase (primpol)-like protein